MKRRTKFSLTTESPSKLPKKQGGYGLSKAEQSPDDGSSPISEIPLELFDHTLSFLPLSKHLELRTTSKQFHQSWNNVLGRQMYQQHGSQTADNIDDWSDALWEGQRKEIDYLLKNKNVVLFKTQSAQPVIDAYDKMKQVNELPMSSFALHAREKILDRINEAIICSKIEECKKIRFMNLDCSNYCLTRFPPKIIKKQIIFFKKIWLLNLQGNQLTALPENIAQCVKLEMLNVSDNLLMALPKNIGQCVELNHIIASENRLTALPENIDQCVKLETLNVSDNLLTALPENIGQCVRLDWLVVNNNQLTALPASIGQCVALHSILASENLLTSLPAELSQCSNIYIFDVNANFLIDLPNFLSEGIFRDSKLQSITKNEVLASQKVLEIPNNEQEEEPSLTNRKLKRN